MYNTKCQYHPQTNGKNLTEVYGRGGTKTAKPFGGALKLDQTIGGGAAFYPEKKWFWKSKK